MAKGSFASTADALAGIRREKEGQDTRDQNLIFRLAAHDPVAAGEMFSRRFPEFGPVTFRGEKGNFRFFSTESGVFAVDAKNPTNAFQVEGIPGKQRTVAGVPARIKKRLRLQGVDPNTLTEEEIQKETELDVMESSAEKAQDKFQRLTGLLAGTDKQFNKAIAEIETNPYLKHTLRPVMEKQKAGLIGFREEIDVLTDEKELDERLLRQALAREALSEGLPEGSPILAQKARPGTTDEGMMAETKIRARITTGQHKGRVIKVLESEFDPRNMEKVNG